MSVPTKGFGPSIRMIERSISDFQIVPIVVLISLPRFGMILARLRKAFSGSLHPGRILSLSPNFGRVIGVIVAYSAH